MERQAAQPVNLKDAKARLRAVATGGQALSWVRSYPREGILVAFILGVLIGASSSARHAFTSGLLALLKRSRL